MCAYAEVPETSAEAVITMHDHRGRRFPEPGDEPLGSQFARVAAPRLGATGERRTAILVAFVPRPSATHFGMVAESSPVH